MRFRLVIAVVSLSLATIAGPSAQSQQSGRPERHRGMTLRLETNLVVIEVTATDQAGNYVRDLRQDEVQVFEDGHLRKINFFAMTDESALSRPLAIVFALDLSGSLRPDEMMTLRQAALKFTELMKGEPVFAALALNYSVNTVQAFR